MLLKVALGGVCCGSGQFYPASVLGDSAQVLEVQRTVSWCRPRPIRARGALVREDAAASTPTNRCSLFNSNNYPMLQDGHW